MLTSSFFKFSDDIALLLKVLREEIIIFFYKFLMYS
jgi:hypothetical protein